MFQPIVPIGGYGGWKVLERTLERQTTAFEQSTSIKREVEHFKEKMPQITSADQLLSDRQSLSVALGAFGLSDDINNTAFLKRLMTDGVEDGAALANRLSDTRYREFAAAFDFSSVPAAASGNIDSIVDQFHEAKFEVAIGAQDDNLRLALNTKREISKIADQGGSNNTGWYTMMGNPPLRQVFEKALGLPSSFAGLDLDKQLEVFQDRAQSVFGTSEFADLAKDDQTERVIQQFLLRAELDNFNQATSSASIALTLLSS